jgi:hypothetical protein
MRQHVMPPTPPQRSPVKQLRFAVPEWIKWGITWLGIVGILVLYIISASQDSQQSNTTEGREPNSFVNEMDDLENNNEDTVNSSALPDISLGFNDPIVVDFGEKIEIIVSATRRDGTIVAKLLRSDGTEVEIPPQSSPAQMGDNIIIFDPPQINNHYLVGDFKLSVELDGKEIHRKVRVLPPAVKITSIMPYLVYDNNYLIIPNVSSIQLDSEQPVLAQVQIRTSLTNENQNAFVVLKAGEKSIDLPVTVGDPFSVQQAESLDIIFDNVWMVETNTPMIINLKALVLSAPRFEDSVFSRSFVASSNNETLLLLDKLECGKVINQTTPFLWVYQLAESDDYLAVMQGYLQKGFLQSPANQWSSQLFIPTLDSRFNTYYVPVDIDPTKITSSRLEGLCIFQQNPNKLAVNVSILTTELYQEKDQLGRILIVGRVK